MFCRGCGKVLKNVWKHQGSCPEVKRMLAEAKAGAKRKRQLPKSQPVGGTEFLSKLKVYLENQLGKITAGQYNRKAAQIAAFWETNVNHFVLDKLLQPLDWNAMFPSITNYLVAATTTGDGLTAIKVYKHMVDFTVEVFEER